MSGGTNGMYLVGGKGEYKPLPPRTHRHRITRLVTKKIGNNKKKKSIKNRRKSIKKRRNYKKRRHTKRIRVEKSSIIDSRTASRRAASRISRKRVFRTMKQKGGVLQDPPETTALLDSTVLPDISVGPPHVPRLKIPLASPDTLDLPGPPVGSPDVPSLKDRARTMYYSDDYKLKPVSDLPRLNKYEDRAGRAYEVENYLDYIQNTQTDSIPREQRVQQLRNSKERKKVKKRWNEFQSNKEERERDRVR